MLSTSVVMLAGCVCTALWAGATLVRVRVLLGATARPPPCPLCVSQGAELQAVAVLMP